MKTQRMPEEIIKKVNEEYRKRSRRWHFAPFYKKVGYLLDNCLVDYTE